VLINRWAIATVALLNFRRVGSESSDRARNSEPPHDAAHRAAQLVGHAGGDLSDGRQPLRIKCLLAQLRVRDSNAYLLPDGIE
jgi:hypothetical protein